MKKIIVNIILDSSGSMDSIKESTISGFNEYVATLKKDEKHDYEITLVTFDTTSKKVYDRVPVKSIKRLNDESYKCSGGTALYDAVVPVIRDCEAGGNEVITVMITDGEENSSRIHTHDELSLLIKALQNAGRQTFVYLGANQDSFAKAQKLNINMAGVANFHASSTGTSNMMRSVANNTVAYASMGGQSAGASFFSKSDQDNLNTTK